MKDFSLFVRSVEKIQKVKSKGCKDKNGKNVLSSKCAVCCSKISKAIKEQEAKGLLSSLRIKASLSKIL